MKHILSMIPGDIFCKNAIPQIWPKIGWSLYRGFRTRVGRLLVNSYVQNHEYGKILRRYAYRCDPGNLNVVSFLWWKWLTKKIVKISNSWNSQKCNYIPLLYTYGGMLQRFWFCCSWRAPGEIWAPKLHFSRFSRFRGPFFRRAHIRPNFSIRRHEVLMW